MIGETGCGRVSLTPSISDIVPGKRKRIKASSRSPSVPHNIIFSVRERSSSSPILSIIQDNRVISPRTNAILTTIKEIESEIYQEAERLLRIWWQSIAKPARVLIEFDRREQLGNSDKSELNTFEAAVETIYDTLCEKIVPNLVISKQSNYLSQFEIENEKQPLNKLDSKNLETFVLESQKLISRWKKRECIRDVKKLSFHIGLECVDFSELHHAETPKRFLFILTHLNRSFETDYLFNLKKKTSFLEEFQDEDNSNAWTNSYSSKLLARLCLVLGLNIDSILALPSITRELITIPLEGDTFIKWNRIEVNGEWVTAQTTKELKNTILKMYIIDADDEETLQKLLLAARVCEKITIRNSLKGESIEITAQDGVKLAETLRRWSGKFEVIISPECEERALSMLGGFIFSESSSIAFKSMDEKLRNILVDEGFVFDSNAKLSLEVANMEIQKIQTWEWFKSGELKLCMSCEFCTATGQNIVSVYKIEGINRIDQNNAKEILNSLYACHHDIPDITLMSPRRDSIVRRVTRSFSDVQKHLVLMPTVHSSSNSQIEMRTSIGKKHRVQFLHQNWTSDVLQLESRLFKNSHISSLNTSESKTQSYWKCVLGDESYSVASIIIKKPDMKKRLLKLVSSVLHPRRSNEDGIFEVFYKCINHNIVKDDIEKVLLRVIISNIEEKTSTSKEPLRKLEAGIVNCIANDSKTELKHAINTTDLLVFPIIQRLHLLIDIIARKSKRTHPSDTTIKINTFISDCSKLFKLQANSPRKRSWGLEGFLELYDKQKEKLKKIILNCINENDTLAKEVLDTIRAWTNSECDALLLQKVESVLNDYIKVSQLSKTYIDWRPLDQNGNHYNPGANFLLDEILRPFCVELDNVPIVNHDNAKKGSKQNTGTVVIASSNEVKDKKIKAKITELNDKIFINHKSIGFESFTASSVLEYQENILTQFFEAIFYDNNIVNAFLPHNDTDISPTSCEAQAARELFLQLAVSYVKNVFLYMDVSIISSSIALLLEEKAIKTASEIPEHEKFAQTLLSPSTLLVYLKDFESLSEMLNDPTLYKLSIFIQSNLEYFENYQKFETCKIMQVNEYCKKLNPEKLPVPFALRGARTLLGILKEIAQLTENHLIALDQLTTMACSILAMSRPSGAMLGSKYAREVLFKDLFSEWHFKDSISSRYTIETMEEEPFYRVVHHFNISNSHYYSQIPGEEGKCRSVAYSWILEPCIIEKRLTWKGRILPEPSEYCGPDGIEQDLYAKWQIDYILTHPGTVKNQPGLQLSITTATYSDELSEYINE